MPAAQKRLMARPGIDWSRREASTADRARQPPCSPTWVTLPQITSSTAWPSRPLRSFSASSTCADRPRLGDLVQRAVGAALAAGGADGVVDIGVGHRDPFHGARRRGSQCRRRAGRAASCRRGAASRAGPRSGRASGRRSAARRGRSRRARDSRGSRSRRSRRGWARARASQSRPSSLASRTLSAEPRRAGEEGVDRRRRACPRAGSSC